MNSRNLILTALLALSLLSCGHAAPTSAEPDRVAALALELRANPDKADSILGKHGIDRVGFDALMYEIAIDPEKSNAYKAALGGR